MKKLVLEEFSKKKNKLKNELKCQKGLLERIKKVCLDCISGNVRKALLAFGFKVWIGGGGATQISFPPSSNKQAHGLMADSFFAYSRSPALGDVLHFLPSIVMPFFDSKSQEKTI
jgi:hypothetical protein